MILQNHEVSLDSIKKLLPRFWELSGQKILDIEENYDTKNGSPVFTMAGKYTTRGWTEWTQGFVYGSSLLQFEATGEATFLEIGKKNTLAHMAPHISHDGVHDHGFNNVSTYGNLLRLAQGGKYEAEKSESQLYELAIKISGAVQASRWTTIPEGGYIYSFNGPHSLFVDTIRSCRALMLSHKMGHVYQSENDKKIDLLGRALDHMKATAKYAVYYGEGRDAYDISGRTAHESVFNTNDGNFRCPNSQQGYSGFTTWTRGLAWAMCGFTEELEFLDTLSDEVLTHHGGRKNLYEIFIKAAAATCDFYLKHTPTDGIPYWDTGAPGLAFMENYLAQEADPFNHYEPVDASAAAIAAQGLLRFSAFLKKHPEYQKIGHFDAETYRVAALVTTQTLLEEPYLSTKKNHQGLLLHSIYHRPNGWDFIPDGSKIPNGEACQWGDYHLRELALYLQKEIDNTAYYTFFNHA